MHLTALARQSLADGVFEQLRDRILSGQIRPGSSLPSERALCAQLEVNRQSLREGLGRLQQVGLISVRQGESTRVLDYREHGGLELLVALVSGPAGDVRTDVVRSFIEMRAALAPDIAAGAARRRSQAQVDALRESVDRLRELDDVIERHDEHLRFWSAVVDASGNIAYRLMFNTLRRALEVVGDIVAPAVVAETEHTAGYAALSVAIARRRPRSAEKATADLVGRGTRSMLDLLDKLEVV
jgi:DNA-binding FadR family transcriptional regulator